MEEIKLIGSRKKRTKQQNVLIYHRYISCCFDWINLTFCLNDLIQITDF